ncbi:MAG: ATP-binding protein [Planctomycetes bacterium]|nr:ATP-binding protein [Planctomycetota bacterium]
MVLWAAGLVAALALAYGLVLVPAIREVILREEADALDLYARLAAGHIELGLEAAFHELEDLAAAPGIRSGDRARVDPALARADARTHAFLFFYLMDARGVIVARPSREERVGEDRSAGEYFRGVAVAGKPRHVSDVWRTPLDNRTVTLSVPVRGEDGGLVGVLVGVLGCMDRNQRIYRFVMQPPRVDGYELALLTATDRTIARSDGWPLAVEQPVRLPPAGAGFIDEAEERWLVAVAPVPRTGWKVVARVPEAQVQDALGRATRTFAALVVLVIGVVFAVGVVGARRISRRLGGLTSALTRYGRDGRSDPVADAGRDEVGAAAAAFNRMLEERDRAEAERAALEERLRQAARMETVGRFATGVAHDLNNLLTPILSYAELLQAQAAPDAPEREWTGEILRVSAQARELAMQVLAYGRAAAPRRERLALAPLVADALRTLEGAALPGVTLERALEEDVAVLGDPTQLQQVVLNLVTNALQALGPGGGRVEVRLAREARRARLSVRDTGAGLDEATRARVFEPFFTTKAARRGTGLGLAIVHGIVTAHGGEVHVTSAPGAGSTFEVLLPLDGALSG